MHSLFYSSICCAHTYWQVTLHSAICTQTQYIVTLCHSWTQYIQCSKIMLSFSLINAFIFSQTWNPNVSEDTHSIISKRLEMAGLERYKSSLMPGYSLLFMKNYSCINSACIGCIHFTAMHFLLIVWNHLHPRCFNIHAVSYLLPNFRLPAPSNSNV